MIDVLDKIGEYRWAEEHVKSKTLGTIGYRTRLPKSATEHMYLAPVKQETAYRKSPSVLHQYRVLSQRSLKHFFREPEALLKVSLISMIMVFMTGSVFYNIDRDDCDGSFEIVVPSQNRMGCMYFILIMIWTTAMMYMLEI